MEFIKFVELIQKQFDSMKKFNLFKTELDKDIIWETYINSFKIDPVFRHPESTKHTCWKDRHWLRRYSNIIAINKENEIITLWDFPIKEDNFYYDTVIAMRNLVKSSKIIGKFVESKDYVRKMKYNLDENKHVQLGYNKSYKIYKEDETFGNVTPNVGYTFYHFHLNVPKEILINESIESFNSDFSSNVAVLKRGLDEFSLDNLKLALEFCQEDCILNGKSHVKVIESFIKIKESYDQVTDKEAFVWNNVNLAPIKFRNTAIGVFIQDLHSIPFEEAIMKCNKMFDPINFKIAKTPITSSQKKDSIKEINERGYADSFDRRSATINDINIDEIIHVNKGNNKVISKFDIVKTASSNDKLNKDNIPQISIENFMKDIIPNSKEVFVHFENKMIDNLVTLHCSKEKDSKIPFKWNNTFAWTYNGNLAGKSQISTNVVNAGGKINGIVRCSLQWNDEDTKSIIDYDLHCVEKINGKSHNTICFRSKLSHINQGANLDVDMIRPKSIGIENIVFPKIVDGVYEFFVNHYDASTSNGFKVELEVDGKIFEYFYQNKTTYKQNVQIATITVKNNTFQIEHHLEHNEHSKTIWNIESNKFHSVKLACVSPNYWNEEIGSKHYFFFIEGCKTNEEMKGFHTEFLNQELSTQPTRKFIDIFSSFYKYQPSDDQLSGIGFNSSIKDNVIVKVDNKMYNVFFKSN